ncbi:MAG: dockerin type I repeat-containing protein [Ruminococcus sp.]|nr:dockerin type I repeat-containing protein [Ruminococcus sp.]
MKAKRLVSAVLATAMAFSCAVSASAFTNNHIGEKDFYPLFDKNGNTIGYRSYKIGDINNDWKINITDYTLVASFVAGKDNILKYEGWFDRADCNRDGRVDLLDRDIIASYITGRGK